MLHIGNSKGQSFTTDRELSYILHEQFLLSKLGRGLITIIPLFTDKETELPWKALPENVHRRKRWGWDLNSRLGMPHQAPSAPPLQLGPGSSLFGGFSSSEIL